MLLSGLIPIIVRPPNLLNLATTLPTVRMVVDVSKAAAVLSTALIIRILRSKVTRLRIFAVLFQDTSLVDNVIFYSSRHYVPSVPKRSI